MSAVAKMSGVEALVRAQSTLSSPWLTATRDPFAGLALSAAGVSVAIHSPSKLGAPPPFTVRTPFGEGQIPEAMKAHFERQVNEVVAKISREGREKFVADMDSLGDRASEVLAMKDNRFGVGQNATRGYVERPGHNGGSSEWIYARDNRAGSGAVLEGLLNGTRFELRCEWNPATRKQDLVLRGWRAHPVDAHGRMQEERWGAEAKAFFDIVKSAFRDHPKIRKDLSYPS